MDHEAETKTPVAEVTPVDEVRPAPLGGKGTITKGVAQDTTVPPEIALAFEGAQKQNRKCVIVLRDISDKRYVDALNQKHGKQVPCKLNERLPSRAIYRTL